MSLETVLRCNIKLGYIIALQTQMSENANADLDCGNYYSKVSSENEYSMFMSEYSTQ